MPGHEPRAKLVLREKNPAEVMPALTAWEEKIAANDSQADHDRLEALWVCENLDAVNQPLLERLLKATDPHARAAAAIIVGHWAGELHEPLKLLEPLVSDDHPRVRLEAVRALSQIPQPESIVLATKVLKMPTDSFIDYALWPDLQRS